MGIYKNADGQMDYDGDAHKLESAQQRVDQKVAAFEQQKAYLFRPDGTLKYSQKEHQEQLTALLEPVREAVAEAKQTADEVRGRCDEEAKLKDTDPLLRLTKSDEQAEVTYKQALVENDAEKLPLSTLATRLEAIALHGSKVEKLLYARFARRRVEDERQALRKQPSGYNPPEGYAQVSRALEALEKTTIDSKLQERLKRAEERRNAATKLTMHATQKLRDADGSNERDRRQYEQRLRNMF